MHTTSATLVALQHSRIQTSRGVGQILESHSRGGLLTIDRLVEALRIGTDLMHVFFVIDEYTDVEPTSGVREIVRIVVDVLDDPEKPRPEGEMMLGEFTRQ